VIRKILYFYRLVLILLFFPFSDDHAPLDWEKILPPADQRHQIIDIGANLGHKRFSFDWEQVVDQAVEAGVKQIIITGTSVRDSIRALELVKQKPGVLYSTGTCTGLALYFLFDPHSRISGSRVAGVHPHDAKSCDDKTIGILRDLAKNPEVVAIGECGLDFDRMFSPKEVQLKWFEEQLRLAIELKKPVFLHERAAGEDFVNVLRKFPQDQLPRLCVHCFTGDSAEVKRYLQLGCYIGITGWINDDMRGKDLQKAVKLVPLDRLMIETDAPFLAPKDIPDVRISRNEPGVLPQVLRKVAECIGQPIDVIAEATRKTTQEFFGIP
jgi:TatD DNase family protein